MKKFRKQIMVPVAQFCEYTKTHWIVHFKKVNYISIKFENEDEIKAFQINKLAKSRTSYSIMILVQKDRAG